ncbi:MULTISPECIES: YciI family protein [unclassified Streptomyces]|uniref:YciI family protein n=1 Tax=unclassified Streptomyces TaxID=2593676 RepID=UPI0016606368|nr:MULTISPECIES: YciI family protein [unclassified Streptomyces]MBD0709287.1 hypothetical protein [Streptomyces sp. CBMA291]MBD0712623.1 hypothetical protein [Streptomyces sp. CBMA370]
MKYLVMVECTETDYEAMAGRSTAGGPTWGEKDLQAMFSHMGALNEELRASGELIDAQGLAAPSTTRFVTVDATGAPVVTDAPYPETKVVIAGFWILDCPSLDRATEIATRAARSPQPPGTPTYPVVIRPIDEGGPGEE